MKMFADKYVGVGDWCVSAATMLSQIRLFTDVVQCPPREPELINNYYHRVAAEDADNAAGRAATLVMSN
jgi:hypothetical protein